MALVALLPLFYAGVCGGIGGTSTYGVDGYVETQILTLSKFSVEARSVVKEEFQSAVIDNNLQILNKLIATRSCRNEIRKRVELGQARARGCRRLGN